MSCSWLQKTNSTIMNNVEPVPMSTTIFTSVVEVPHAGQGFWDLFTLRNCYMARSLAVPNHTLLPGRAGCWLLRMQYCRDSSTQPRCMCVVHLWLCKFSYAFNWRVCVAPCEFPTRPTELYLKVYVSRRVFTSLPSAQNLTKIGWLWTHLEQEPRPPRSVELNPSYALPTH